MRFRTFLGVLLAVVVAIAVAYLSNLNSDLLATRFAVTPQTSVPLHTALLVAFLAGFLPVVSALLTQTLRRDLAARRARRLERQAKSLDMSFRRAVDYEADGLFQRAAAELENVLAERPEDFSTLVRYGEVLRRLGRTEEAMEVHRRASVLYPQSVAVLYQLSQDYAARGDLEVAEQIRDRILRDFPAQGLAELRSRRAAHLGAESWREAREAHEAIEKLLGDQEVPAERDQELAVVAGLEYQRAVSLLEEDRFDEAGKLLDKILAREPRFVPALILAGEVERLKDDPDGAVAAWCRGFEATGSPVFLLRIEDHFIERNEPLEAISTLHALRDAAASNVLPRFFLGRLYYRLEMHEEAQRSLAGLAEELEESPTYHFLMGRIQEKLGRSEEALAAFRTGMQRAGVTHTDFVCRVCQRSHAEWSDRCVECGSWNSIDLDFEQGPYTAEELGVRLAPVRAIYDRYRAWSEAPLESAPQTAPDGSPKAGS